MVTFGRTSNLQKLKDLTEQVKVAKDKWDTTLFTDVQFKQLLRQAKIIKSMLEVIKDKGLTSCVTKHRLILQVINYKHYHTRDLNKLYY